MKEEMPLLWDHLQELSRIGRNADGSITRFPFTEEDRQAEALLWRYMEEAGISVSRDAAGNLIGRWEPADGPESGQEYDARPLVAGSHYDTVLEGGAFDGCLGLLAAIESVRCLREEGFRPARPVWVVGFKDEEGNRFGYGMIGSRSMCGKAEPEGLSSRDESGITLGDAMRASGLDPGRLDTCRIEPAAMLELHIEQGSVLEESGCTVGAVEGIAGLERYTVRIEGCSAHAGATPMGARRDPVPAMSRWILKVTELARQRENCVATVGCVEVRPGACNIICQNAEFSLDIRSVRDADIREIMEEMAHFEAELEHTERIRITRTLEQALPAAPCDSRLREMAERICRERGLACRRLMSGAGHDSMNFSGLCPIGMIFVPSKDGLSHRREEYTSREDCQAGAIVLREMIRECAAGAPEERE